MYLKFATLLVLGCMPLLAEAHAFIQPYKLPMPYWMYIYGAVAALVLSFVVLVLTVRKRSDESTLPVYAFGDVSGLQWLRRFHFKTAAQIFTVLLLGLCISSGLWGNQDPARNINMTLFWVIFTLGFTYFVALVGDVYELLNPWKNIAIWIAKSQPNLQQGRWRYPAWLGHWPALLLYMAFIWVELLGNTRPFSLSVYLLVYTGINALGVGAWGIKNWFRYGEFFAVFMRLVALCAPLRYSPDASTKKRWSLQWPFTGLLVPQKVDVGLMLFVLFMLSSTAFDGLRETTPWFQLFWHDKTGFIESLIGKPPLYAYVQLRPWYVAWDSLVLWLSPSLYLAAFMLFLWLGKRLVPTPLSVLKLAQRFVLSLVPIAVVYHATHYYSLLLTQGIKIRAMISDPFGWGWDVFGTIYTMRMPIIPDMGAVWNSQVWLILIGHVASVYVAHMTALRVLPQQRHAALNQLPMLLLMAGFTAFGLWILAQPLQGR